MKEGRKEVFYLTSHSTHFIYGYTVSDIRWMTIPLAREETWFCYYIGYSFRLAASVILYAPSYRQNSIYQSFYTSRETLYGMKNRTVGPPWWIDPIIHRPWANALTTELHLAPLTVNFSMLIMYLGWTVPQNSFSRIVLY